MSFLQRAGGELRLEDVRLSDIARDFGTPCYVYSRAAIESAFRAFDAGLAGVDHLVCYAVKANSNLAILDMLQRLGAGFDIVSGGELARVLAAGGRADRVIFSGVGKSEAEIAYALASGIRCFNVESEPELERIAAVAARAGKRAPVSLRINPDVDARTHPYISTGMAGNKFGIPHGRALEAYRHAARLGALRVTGIDCHIGSQILDTDPLDQALERVLELVDALAAEGIALGHVDLGGGFGIRYRDETPPDIGAYCRRLAQRLRGRGCQVLLEPGRAIVGNAGVLLTRVEYLKTDKAKRFAVVDASMSELIRPALYEAWHDIVPVREEGAPREPARYDVVGPVCESSDVLAHDRTLALAPGDLLAILSAGAYGMAMASNYNSRPRPAEVVVDGALAHLARERESVESLHALEKRLPAA
ncbi:MAG TPA: diaminopimelate decarboxylase [Usitatibacter sp.]|jgi:diaminopimelate decarboxylase|nr:diaminopimelate decarboxylase [Usitatibacter sp.]